MRSNWCKQSERLYTYAKARANVDIPQPELNAAAAGEGKVYVNAYTKRVSEVRKRARGEGCDFILSQDRWVNGQRQTAYKWIQPTP